MFHYWRHTDLVKRAQVQNNLHGRIIMGTFERCFNEGSLWRGHIAVLYFILTKHFLVNFICHGDWCYNWYIKSKISTKYHDGNGTGVKPKQTFTKYYRRIMSKY